MLPDAPTDFLPPVPAACPLPRHPLRRQVAEAWLWVNAYATLALWTAAVIAAGWVLKGWTLG